MTVPLGRSGRMSVDAESRAVFVGVQSRGCALVAFQRPVDPAAVLRERYLHHHKVPFGELLDHVRQFDIGLAPLVDSPFSRSRSDVKLKEYAVAGVRWLASPVGPYVGMGEAQGGMLVEDSDWFDAIDALVRDIHRRAELAQLGSRWAATQTIRHAGSRWEAAFRAAIARARREAGPPAADVAGGH